MKYRINSDGEVLPCTADKKACRFAHFSSVEDALDNIRSRNSNFPPTARKTADTSDTAIGDVYSRLAKLTKAERKGLFERIEARSESPSEYGPKKRPPSK